MPASAKTTAQVVKVLVSELGVRRACRLVARLVDETAGNASYATTVKVLQRMLLGVALGQTPGGKSKGVRR